MRINFFDHETVKTDAPSEATILDNPRILLDVSRWPKDLDAYWAGCRYDVADTHDMHQTWDITMKYKSSPVF